MLWEALLSTTESIDIRLRRYYAENTKHFAGLKYS